MAHKNGYYNGLRCLRVNADFFRDCYAIMRRNDDTVNTNLFEKKTFVAYNIIMFRAINLFQFIRKSIFFKEIKIKKLHGTYSKAFIDGKDDRSKSSL